MYSDCVRIHSHKLHIKYIYLSTVAVGLNLWLQQPTLQVNGNRSVDQIQLTSSSRLVVVAEVEASNRSQSDARRLSRESVRESMELYCGVWVGSREVRLASEGRNLSAGAFGKPALWTVEGGEDTAHAPLIALPPCTAQHSTMHPNPQVTLLNTTGPQ